MYLSNALTNCSDERFFSVLKYIKNYLRSTISSERLNALAMLNIENQLFQDLSFSDLVEEFPYCKVRKRSFIF